jgi:hypothetical protein
MGGKHNDADVRQFAFGSDGFTDFETVFRGHIHVEQNQIRLIGVDGRERFLTIAGSTHIITGLVHEKFQRKYYIRLIIDHEYFFRHD